MVPKPQLWGKLSADPKQSDLSAVLRMADIFGNKEEYQRRQMQGFHIIRQTVHIQYIV